LRNGNRIQQWFLEEKMEIAFEFENQQLNASGKQKISLYSR
jgi:hypothetical protein